MKLISIYISSFGKLKDFSYDFKDGVNSILQENGWGKSTIASFIRAMFYGLTKGGRNIDENDRIKYKPWNSSDKFGGNIKFSKGNKIFIIERFFGNKSSDDTVRVFDAETGKDYINIENLGKRIFEIDEDGFLSTLFISQKDFEIKSNASLTAKFNAYSNENAEEAFNNALKKLDDKQKQYKSRGDKGIIADVKQEIFRVDEDIESSKNATDTIKQLKIILNSQEEKQNRLKAERDELNLKLEKSGSFEADKIKRDTLNNLKSDREVLEREKANCQKILNNNQVESEEINNLSQTISDYYALLEEKKQTANEPKPKEKGGKKYLILIPIFIFLFGIISLIAIDTIIGSVCCGVGFLLFIILFVTLKKNNNIQNGDLSCDKMILSFETKLNEYFSRFNVGVGSFDLLFERLKSAIDSENKYKEKIYEIDKKIADLTSQLHTIKPIDLSNDIEKIKSDLKEKNDELSFISGDIQRTIMKINYNEDSASNLVNFIDKKNELLEKLSNLNDEYNLLTLTIEYLSKADENLKIKYRAPLQESLDKYLSLLTGGKIKATVDIDLKLSVLESGKLIDLDYYSKGYRNLLAICERFALIDVLYPNEKPFIILDDPFSDLDEDNLDMSKKTVCTLADDYQILYLTCHNSRLI